MPQEEKKLYADYLIDTSEGFEHTRRETEGVYRALRDEASTERGDAETRRRGDAEMR
jgi:hypothetical protein